MLSNLPRYLAYIRKALVQIIGLAGALLALGLLPDQYAALGATVIGVLTTITHYLSPNAVAPGTGVAEEPLDEDLDTLDNNDDIADPNDPNASVLAQAEAPPLGVAAETVATPPAT